LIFQHKRSWYALPDDCETPFRVMSASVLIARTQKFTTRFARTLRRVLRNFSKNLAFVLARRALSLCGVYYNLYLRPNAERQFRSRLRDGWK